MPSCAQCSAENAEGTRFCRECGAELDGPDPLLGQEVLGRYRVTALIGEGGMGRVYVAEQRVGTTTRKVAVKTLRAQLSADKQLARRFYREAETIVRLTHPNTIQFFDFGELPDGTLLIVMEFIEGRSLAAELAKGPLAPERADRILAQICGALTEAHALGIVHRDLKPDNVLLTHRGGQQDFVKVLDFGIAKISASDDDKSTKLTQQGMMVGTPPYMSPEQFSGEAIDARSDIYSLGVITYEMLTGKLPFAAKTPWEWASKHLTAEPEPLRVDEASGISQRRAEGIRRALSKTPDQRPASVDELLAAITGQGAPTLRDAPAPPVTHASRSLSPATSTPVLPTPVHASLEMGEDEPATLPTSRAPWLGVAAALALMAAGGAFWAFGGSSRNDSQPPSPPPVVAAAALPAPSERPATSPQAPSPAPASPGAQTPAPGDVPAPGGKRGGAEHVASKSSRRGDPPAAPGNPRPTADARPTQPPVAPMVAAPVPAPSRPTAPAVDPAPAPATPAPSPAASATSTPADLADRIARARAALDDRLESSVAMYQGAARKYPGHPALEPLRRDIAKRADSHLGGLVAGGRCAQAQALFRALSALSAAPSRERVFNARCAAP